MAEGAGGAGGRPPADSTESGGIVTGFRRVGDGVAARFARPEAAIIRDLVEQVVELVEPSSEADRSGRDPEADELARMVGMSAGPAEDAELPDDPVLARLLPDAYRD